MLAILGMPGGWEWLIVLFVALLVFGSRLPSVMRTLARSIAGFRHEMDQAKREVDAESSGNGAGQESGTNDDTTDIRPAPPRDDDA